MKTLAEIIPTAIEGLQQTLQSQPSNAPLAQQSLTIRNDPQGKKRVGEAVVLFASALKTYGKKPDQMEAVTKLFLFALSDYPTDKVIDAMAFYIRNYTDFPAPADIVQIIERGNKPPFDRAVYTTLSKKDPEFRTSDEWAYMRDYENFQKG
jgi:hypothetical protein